MRTSWDIVVIGAGGSGLTAAVSAAEHGLSVLVLEKQPVAGGTTAMAVGSFTANRTGLQRSAGIQDSLAAHLEDVARFAAPEVEARNNPELRALLLTHAAETLEWLQGLGLSFFGPNPEPPNQVPRMHNVVPGARAYILALQKRLLKLGGTVVCDAAVEALVCEAGRVTGVRARVRGDLLEFRAGSAVVLAAGDYANSPDLIAEFKGPQYARIEGINRHATGDGQRLARSVGARLVNMDLTYGPELRFVPPRVPALPQRLPASGLIARLMGRAMPLVPQAVLNAVIKRLLVAWQHPENALFDDGAILLNMRGERFCDERAYPAREIAVAEQPDKQAFLLLDARLCQRYSGWPHFVSTAPRIAYAYVADYLKLRPDVSCAGASLHEVAAQRQLPVAAVESTVTEFNRSVATGIPDRFGRSGDAHALYGSRWVLLGPARAYFTTTEGSPAVDTGFRVLDARNQPIPGLYAVGQNGIGGQVLWGHGLKIAWALTSGRLLGRVLAGLPMSASSTAGRRGP